MQTSQIEDKDESDIKYAIKLQNQKNEFELEIDQLDTHMRPPKPP